MGANLGQRRPVPSDSKNREAVPSWGAKPLRVRGHLVTPRRKPSRAPFLALVDGRLVDGLARGLTISAVIRTPSPITAAGIENHRMSPTMPASC